MNISKKSMIWRLATMGGIQNSREYDVWNRTFQGSLCTLVQRAVMGLLMFSTMSIIAVCSGVFILMGTLGQLLYTVRLAHLYSMPDQLWSWIQGPTIGTTACELAFIATAISVFAYFKIIKLIKQAQAEPNLLITYINAVKNRWCPTVTVDN